MGETLIQGMIRKTIMEIFTTKFQVTRSDIIEECASLASEPTIQQVMKKLEDERIIEVLNISRKKKSVGGRPKKYYQLKKASNVNDYVEEDPKDVDIWDTLDENDGYCVSCIHWGKISPERQRLGSSTDFLAFGGSSARWCERWDKPMFNDEDCPWFSPLPGIRIFTFVKGAQEKLVGFSGRVSVIEDDSEVKAKIYENDAFLIVKNVDEQGIHRCYRIYSDLTRNPYPCESETCSSGLTSKSA